MSITTVFSVEVIARFTFQIVVAAEAHVLAFDLDFVVGFELCWGEVAEFSVDEARVPKCQS